MHISCKGIDISDIRNMGFFVKHRLIKMCDAPTLWDIETQKFCKLSCRLSCHGIAPCSERHKKLVILIKSHITVHHSRNAHCAVCFRINAILCLYVFCKVFIAGLYAPMDIIKRICPTAVLKAVFPLFRP